MCKCCVASFKSRLVLPVWCWLTQVVLEKRPLKGCSSSSSSMCVCHQSYPMSRPCRGKLLLICNDEFDSQPTTDCDQPCQQLPQQLSERHGANVDVYNITTLFRRLQFDLICRNNLTAAVSTCICSVNCIKHKKLVFVICNLSL